MKIVDGIEGLVGNTPLMRLQRLASYFGLNADILVKVESNNPCGSIKDRVALNMILSAEEKGQLKKGTVIVEPTSGNTGIGIAGIARARGYRVILTMPDSMSIERRKLLASYGAELVLTPGSLGMNGAVSKAQEIASQIGGFIPSQFDNPNNPLAHFQTTGKEIWEQTDGVVDIFVSGVGTGGTVSGVGGYLKGMNNAARVVAVEPKKSPLLNGGTAGSHGIQGIGANFIPKNLDGNVYDEVFDVADEDAIGMCKIVAQIEGLLVGISSGANIFTAVEIAKNMNNKRKTIVTVCPDSGERYLSMGIFG